MKKLISLLLALAFVFPSLAWAFKPQNSELLSLSIPKTIGEVCSVHRSGPRTIVFIQDLHCQAEAQNHIAEIIGLLTRAQGLKLVGVEGVGRSVNVTKLSTFPVPAVRERAGQWLLQAGLIGGPEYLAATASRPITLTGIENETLYQESLKSVRVFFNNESLGYVLDLRECLQECKARMAASRRQPDFDACARRLDVIEKMLSVSATAEEVGEFQARREHYSTQAVINSIRLLGQDAQNNLDFEMLDHYLGEAEAFYRMADKRSQCFVDNLDQAMARQGRNLAVMVAGGYHTQGIEQALKERGFSYLVVTPRISQTEPKNNYWQLLQNQQTKLDQALAPRQNLIALPFNNVQVDEIWKNRVICEKNLRELKLDPVTEQRIIRFFHLVQLLLNAGLLSWLAGQQQWAGLAQKYFSCKQAYPADFSGLEIAPLSQAQIRSLQEGRPAVIPLANEPLSLIMCREGVLASLRAQSLSSMNFGNGYDVLVMTHEAAAASRAALDLAGQGPAMRLPALRLTKNIAGLLALTAAALPVQAAIAIWQDVIFVRSFLRDDHPQALLKVLHSIYARFLRPWPHAIRINGKTEPQTLPRNEEEAGKFLADLGVDPQWLRDTFPGIVRSHGIASFARFYLQCGRVSGKTFKKILLELAEAFKPDLPRFWPGILDLTRAAGPEGGWKLFRNLLELPQVFSPEVVEEYWDTLVAQGMKAGASCPAYLSCCIGTVRPLITDLKALQTVSGGLIQLADAYRSLTPDVLPCLETYTDVFGPEAGMKNFPDLVNHLVAFKDEKVDIDSNHPAALVKEILNSLRLVKTRQVNWQGLFELFHAALILDPKAAGLKVSGLIDGLEKRQLEPNLEPGDITRLKNFLGRYYGFYPPLYWLSVHEPETFEHIRDFALRILQDLVGPEEIDARENELSHAGISLSRTAILGAIQMAIPGYRGSANLDDYRMRLNRFQQAGDLRGHVPPALKGKAFGACELKVGDEMHRFEFRVVKGMPYALWGLSSGLCYSGEPEVWQDPNFYLAAMIDTTTQQVAGFINLFQKNASRETNLIVPGLEPNGQLLRQADSREVLLAMENALLEIAQAGNFQGLYLTADLGILSHHEPIRNAARARYQHLHQDLSSLFTHGVNTSWPKFANHFPFVSVYALMQGGKPAENLAVKAGPAASVLDKPAAKKYGKDSRQYGYYTLIGAPLWETPVFQGAGYWLGAYGAAQGNILLQSAGGLWMTAVFAFAHTLAGWIVRAREVGWRRAVSPGYLRSEAGDFGARLLVSGLFSLPFLLLPMGWALLLSFGLHAAYNHAVLQGRLHGPVASLAGKKNHYLARKGTADEEAAAKKYLLEYDLLNGVEQKLPGLVQTYGYTSFRWLHQHIGPKYAQTVFSIGLPRLAEDYSEDDLVRCWPDMLRLAWMAGNWQDDLFLEALPGLTRLFTPDELRAYWDTLVDQALQTQDGCIEFLDAGLKAARPLIVDLPSLKIVTDGLVHLAKKYFSMIYKIYPHLGKIPEVLGPEEGLRQWPEMVSALERLYTSMQAQVTAQLPCMILDSLELVPDKGLEWKRWLDLVCRWVQDDARLASYVQVPGLIQGFKDGDIEPSLTNQTLEKLESFRRETYGFCAPLFRMYQDPERFSVVRDFARSILTDGVGPREVMDLKLYLAGQEIKDIESTLLAAVQIAVPAFPYVKSAEFELNRWRLLSALGDFRGHVPEALRNRPFGACRLEVGNEIHDLEFRVVKGMPFTQWGVNADLCYADDRELWSYPGFFLTAMIDKTTNQVAGFMNLVSHDLHGQSCLMVPGLEPNRQFLARTDPRAVLQAMETALQQIAAAGNYARILLTADLEMSSHRSKMREAVEKRYAGKKLDLRSWFATAPLPRALYFNGFEPFHEVYIVWDKTRCTSALDPLARRHYAGDERGYRRYTLIGAPLWETPLFQGAGYWLLDFGQQQANLLLQAAGGLWMTAAFAFAHTVVEWIVRARDVGWKQALSRDLLQSDAKDFGGRLAVSAAFSLPFFLLPAGPAMLLAIILHACYNYAVLEGWLPAPLATIGPGKEALAVQEQAARDLIGEHVSLPYLQAQYGKVLAQHGYASFLPLFTGRKSEYWYEIEYALKHLRAEYSEEELVRYWPDIMNAVQAAGRDGLRLLDRSLVALHKAWGWHLLEQHWDKLMAESLAAPKFLAPMLEYGWPAIRPALNRGLPIHRAAEGLAQLGKSGGLDAWARYRGLETMQQTLGPDFLASHWEALISRLGSLMQSARPYQHDALFQFLVLYYLPAARNRNSDPWPVFDLFHSLVQKEPGLALLLAANLHLLLQTDWPAAAADLNLDSLLAWARQQPHLPWSPLFRLYLQEGNNGFGPVSTFGSLLSQDQAGEPEMRDLENYFTTKGLADPETALAEAVSLVLPGTGQPYYSLQEAAELLKMHRRAGDLRGHIPAFWQDQPLGEAKFRTADGQELELEFRAVKGAPYGIWGLAPNLCYRQDMNLWEHEGFFLVALIDNKSRQAVGFMNVFQEPDQQGRPLLLLSGIEPGRELLARVSAWDLYPAIERTLQKAAEAAGYQGLYSTADRDIMSHRSHVQYIMRNRCREHMVRRDSLLSRPVPPGVKVDVFYQFFTRPDVYCLWDRETSAHSLASARNDGDLPNENGTAEARARTFVSQYFSLKKLEQYFGQVLGQYGYSPLARIMKNMDRMNWIYFENIFFKSLIREFSAEELLLFWPGIVYLCCQTGNDAYGLFRDGFRSLKKTFEPGQLHAYWGILLSLGLEARGRAHALFPALQEFKGQIEGPEHLRRIGRALARIGRAPGLLVEPRFKAFRVLSENLDSRALPARWNEVVEELTRFTVQTPAYLQMEVWPAFFQYFAPLVRKDKLDARTCLAWLRELSAQDPLPAMIVFNGLGLALQKDLLAGRFQGRSLQELLADLAGRERDIPSPLLRAYLRGGKSVLEQIRLFGSRFLDDQAGEDELGKLTDYFESQGLPAPDAETALAEAVLLVLPGLGARSYNPDQIRDFFRLYRQQGEVRGHIARHVKNPLVGTFAVPDCSGAQLEVTFRVVKGLPFALRGLGSDICYYDDLELWNSPDFLLLAMEDRKAGKILGFVNLFFEQNRKGETLLMLPGIEPNRLFINQADPRHIVKTVEMAARRLAEQEGYAGAYIPYASDLVSHISGILRVVTRLYEKSRVDLSPIVNRKTTLRLKAAGFFFYYFYSYCYRLYEKPAQAASILDPLARQWYAGDEGKYRKYTLVDAPVWETLVFQGGGYWARLQGGFWLQAAGGLWMTAAFAFAHTVVEWIVRARDAGWRQALSRDHLQSDARDFASRLAVSAAFSLPFFLLPAGPAMLLAAVLHALFNYAVPEGRLAGPLASVRIPPLRKSPQAREEEAAAFLKGYFDPEQLQRQFGMVFARYGHVHLAKLVKGLDEHDRRILAMALSGNFTMRRPADSGVRMAAPGRPEFKHRIIRTLKARETGKFTEQEALDYWPGIMYLAFRSGSQACRLFQTGLRDLKTAFPDERIFRTFWPVLVSLGAGAGEAMMPLFHALHDYSFLVGVRNPAALHKIGRGLLRLCRVPGGDLDLRFYAADLFKHHLCGASYEHWDRIISGLASFLDRTDIYARTRMFNTLGTLYSRLLEEGRANGWDVLHLMKEAAGMDARLGPLVFANIGLAWESDGFALDAGRLKIGKVLAELRQSGPATLTPLFRYYLKTGDRGYENVRHFGNLMLADQVGKREMADLQETVRASGPGFDSEAALAEAVHTVLPGAYTLEESKKLLQDHYRAGDLRKHVALHVKNPVLGTYWVPAFDGGMNEIEFRVVKGIPYGNWGLSTGLCFYDDMKLWTDENFLLLAMVDKTHGQVAGFVHLYFEKNRLGEKVLLLPGLEPITDVLAQIRPKPLLEAMKESLARLCFQESLAGAYIPKTRHLISHDEGFADLIKHYFEPAKITDMSAVLGRDTSACRENDGFLKYYTFREGWAVWERTGRAEALDPGGRDNPGSGLQPDLSHLALKANLFRLILQAVGNTPAGPVAKALALRLDPKAYMLACLQTGKYPVGLRGIFLDAGNRPKPWFRTVAADQKILSRAAIIEIAGLLAANPADARLTAGALNLLRSLAPLAHIRVGAIQGQPVYLPGNLWTRGQEHCLGNILDALQKIPNLTLNPKAFHRRPPLHQRICPRAA